MTSPSALVVFIGVLGALIGVYFRESLRRAYRQKLVATKLEAQINNLIRELMKSEFKKILGIVSVWRDERATALRTRGSAGLLEVEQKYGTILQEIKKAVEEGSADVDLDIEKFYKTYKEMSPNVFDYHKEQYEVARESIYSGRGLLTEEEAAELSWGTAARVSALRTHATNLIHHFISMSLVLREMTPLNIRVIRPLLSQILEDMIYLSLEIEPLRIKAERIRKASVLSLAVTGYK